MYILAQAVLSCIYILAVLYMSQPKKIDQYSGTKQKSPRRLHTASGSFAQDYPSEPKRLRSLRLTDTAWEKLAEIAEKNHITRTEVVEIFARGEDLY